MRTMGEDRKVHGEQALGNLRCHPLGRGTHRPLGRLCRGLIIVPAFPSGINVGRRGHPPEDRRSMTPNRVPCHDALG